MNEDPRIEQFRSILAETDALLGQPATGGQHDTYSALSARWVELLCACGLNRILLYRAAAEALDCNRPPDDPGTVADQRAALAVNASQGEAGQTQFLNGLARVLVDLRELIPPVIADLAAGDARRLVAGEAPLVLRSYRARSRANSAGDPAKQSAERLIVLRLEFEMGKAGCGLERLLDAPELMGLGLGRRTVESWQSMVPRDERDSARKLGKLVGAEGTLYDADRALLECLLRYTLEDMVRGHSRMRSPITARTRLPRK